MNRLFQAVLRLSAGAALIAVVVMVVRALLARYMPRSVTRLLWTAVLLRAVLPLRFSIIPAVRLRTAGPQIVGTLPPSLIPEVRAAVSSGIGVWLWAAGVVTMLLVLLFLYAGLSRCMRFAIPAAGPLRINGKSIPILTSETVSSPVVWGILRPRIILPPCVDGRILDMILVHEEIHIRRRDYLLKPLMLAILAFHWFNPALWAAFFLWSCDTELSCDEAAVTAIGDPSGYAGTLLAMAARQNGLFQFGFAVGESGVKGRVRAILLRRKPLRAGTLCAVLVTLAALFCAFTETTHTVASTKSALYTAADGQFSVAGDALVETGLSMPVAGDFQTISPYGSRYGGEDFHTGVDMTVEDADGKPVLAAEKGRVILVNPQETPGYGYGKYMIIDHGQGITTLYAHCSELLVQEGQDVAGGQRIGSIGSTGWAQEPHLHFEVRVGNPAEVQKRSGSITVDPMPWLQPEGQEIRRQDRQKALEQLEVPPVNQETQNGDLSVEVSEAAQMAALYMLGKQIQQADGAGAAVQIDVSTGGLLAAWRYPAQNS